MRDDRDCGAPDLGPASDGWRDPAAAVTLALVVNTLVKLGIAAVMGADRFRAYVVAALAAMAVAGALAGITLLWI